MSRTKCLEPLLQFFIPEGGRPLDACLVLGGLRTGYRPTVYENVDRGELFLVSGLVHQVDGNSVNGFGLPDGTYQYTSVGGALKTVRKLQKRSEIRAPALVLNLNAPLGTKFDSLPCMKISTPDDSMPMFDCGVPYTKANKRLLTNGVATRK